MDEIKQRFGKGSQKREVLFRGLASLVGLLRKRKRSIKRFLLNGSFVTNKESPGDIDCILMLSNDFNFDDAEVEQLRRAKRLFGVHLFTFMEEDEAHYHRLVDFFGHSRDEKPKGLVEVIL